MKGEGTPYPGGHTPSIVEECSVLLRGSQPRSSLDGFFLLMHVYRASSGACLGIGVAFVLLFFLATDAHGQEGQPKVVGSTSIQQIDHNWRDCGLRKLEYDAHVTHRPDPVLQRKQSATIQVNYGDGFTDEAQAAFQRAVEIWETHISSPVPIVIDASFSDFDSENALGGAGPNLIHAWDTNRDGNIDTVIGDALTDAIAGEDQNPGETANDNPPDIIAQFNRDRDDWHFGEGDAPSGRIDFTSVVLHEIGHGLNYIDIFSYDDGEGRYGIDWDQNGTVDDDERFAGVYGQRVVEQQPDGQLLHLTNENVYPNPSQTLGDALTSDQLFFEGPSSEAGAEESVGPVPPKLYAPEEYDEGSSISHLDEDTYGFETINALMTPRVNSAETIRLPGPIVCGQLEDIGWETGAGCQQYFSDVYALQLRTVGAGGSLQLSWNVNSDAEVEEYVVERQYFDGPFEEVRQVEASQLEGNTVTIEDLGLGVFTFRLRWVRSDGTEETSPAVTDSIYVQNYDIDTAEPDEQGRVSVDLSWEVPPGTGNFDYLVERRAGTEGNFQTLATTSQTSYTLDRQPPGRYQYRVTAQDQEGNTVVGQPEEVQIDLAGELFVLGPYPNPVREEASFDLTAREEQSVTIEVYDALGRQVYVDERIVEAQVPTFLSIDASQWSGGMYFLRVTGDEFVETREMVVLR